MSAGVPTQKQYDRLSVVARPHTALVIAGKRDWGPLVRRGWVRPEDPAHLWSFLRITPEGLRALAAAVEKYGLRGLGNTERGEA